jgi:hypothetical protein
MVQEAVVVDPRRNPPAAVIVPAVMVKLLDATGFPNVSVTEYVTPDGKSA